MPKPARLGPDWLTALLCQWGRRRLNEASRGIGYYTVNPMLRDGIPCPARSYEPTGYSAQDFKDIECAVGELESVQQLSVARFCMPWRVKSIDAEHPELNNRQWLVHLRCALSMLEGKLGQPAP